MTIRLGEGWLDRVVPPAVLIEDETKRQVELDDLRQEQLLVALAALREALLELPPPVVHVDAPDLSAIVQAVTGLKPGADAQDIAAAVVAQISGQQDKQSLDVVLAKLVDKLEDLDFRMKGIGRQGGSGGGISDLTDRPLRQLGIVSTTEAANDVRFDWQAVASTSVPLYQGTATPGTASSAPSWRIEKYTYITGPAGEAVPSVIQTAYGAWDDRASLF